MINRRSLTAASLAAPLVAPLAAPLFFVRNAWAQGKSINVGTYTGPQGEFVRRQVIPKFQADLGCRVFQTEGVTLGQIAILRTQKANPTYSVMFMDDVGVPIARDEGLIAPLPKDKIPNLAKLVPRWLINEGHAAAFAISAIAPFYNTAIKPIESYAELWDERFRGRFLMVTPKQTQSLQMLTVAASIATGKPILEAQYLIDQAWDKMAALKPNVQTVYDNNVTAVLQTSQGQADIGGPDFSKTVLPYTMKKAPVDMCYPKEGAFAGVNTLTLVKNAPEPDLACAFIDRMLENSVQKALAEYTYAAPSVSGVDLNAVTAKVAPYPETRMTEMKLFVLDWSFFNPRRGAIVEKLSAVFS